MIDDATDNAAIVALINGVSGRDRVWIGLNDKTTEGSFEWVREADGVSQIPLGSYAPWDTDEPSNDNAFQDCVHLLDTGNPIGPNRLDAVLRAGINAAPRRSYADALQGVPSSATRPKKGVDTLLKAMEKTAFPNPWLKSRRDQLLKALQDDAASNDELFKEVSKLKTLLKELRGELELDDDARGERIQTLETRVKEEEAKVAALTKRLENVQVEKGDAVEVIGKLEAKLAEQTVRSETLAEELQLAETEKQLDDENSTTIIKDLDVQIANLKDQIAEAERQATGTRTELVIHKAALEEMENRLLRQMTERDIVVQDLKAWQQDLVDETAGLKRTREALSSIENLEVNIKPPPELGERVNSAGI